MIYPGLPVRYRNRKM